MEYYKLEKDLIINQSSESPVVVKAGNYVMTEATGELSSCKDEELQGNIARIEADIVVRDAQIEADRIAAEQAAQQETPPEEPTP